MIEQPTIFVCYLPLVMLRLQRQEAAVCAPSYPTGDDDDAYNSGHAHAIAKKLLFVWNHQLERVRETRVVMG